MKKASKTPTVALTGGGSGGHITPILSVAREIRAKSPGARLIYIGQKGDKMADIILEDGLFDEIRRIRAGKWRRYHGESVWEHVKDLPTLVLNIRDLFYLIAGVFQAYKLLLAAKPDSLFIKGGYVGLPVGIAAKIRGLPFMTHDSDAIPGLTNKIVGQWARLHATGMPKQYYDYPKEKTVYTGIPLISQFAPVDSDQKAAFRKQIGIPDSAEMIFVVGGGLGAQRLNEAILEIAPQLLKNRPKLHIVNISGLNNFDSLNENYKIALGPAQLSRLKLMDFTNELYAYSGAADIVVMRAGATNMAEMATQGKACILVPNPFLTGGHQLKNAAAWEENGAVKLFDESQPPQRLYETIEHLLNHPKVAKNLEKSIQSFSRPKAAAEIARLLLDMSEGK